MDPARIIEVAFDSYEYEAYRDPAQHWQYVKERITDDGQYYVLFDEVQLLVDFEAVLNGLIRMANVDVYVTGSNAKISFARCDHRVSWPWRRAAHGAVEFCGVYVGLRWQ